MNVKYIYIFLIFVKKKNANKGETSITLLVVFFLLVIAMPISCALSNIILMLFQKMRKRWKGKDVYLINLISHVEIAISF